MSSTSRITVATEEKQTENVDAKQSYVAGKVDESSFLLLPVVLTCQILSLLPSDDIFSCTCVCKLFREIIRDPSFADIHLSKAPHREPSLLIQDRLGASGLFIAPIRDLDKYEPEKFYISFWKTLSTMPFHISNIAHSLSIIVGSCNGLLCLHHLINDISYLYVFNPVLGEFMLIPKLRRALDWVIGFGFCPITKEYKILRSLSCEQFEIYTMGTENWRMIENFKSPIIPSFNPCFNRNFHWITLRKLICAFSLETEQFRYIPLPPQFDEDYSYTNMGTFDGLLCVWHIVDQAIFEVCMMMDYGVAESWTNMISIDRNSIFGPFLRSSIKFLGNGALVFGYRDSPLVYYNIRDGTAKNMKSKSSYDAIYFEPSFISLKRIVPECMVEVVQRNRLKVHFLPCYY